MSILVSKRPAELASTKMNLGIVGLAHSDGQSKEYSLLVLMDQTSMPVVDQMI